jgi:hypothetical protein
MTIGKQHNGNALGRLPGRTQSVGTDQRSRKRHLDERAAREGQRPQRANANKSMFRTRRKVEHAANVTVKRGPQGPNLRSLEQGTQESKQIGPYRFSDAALANFCAKVAG